jgi:hypothetical protein
MRPGIKLAIKFPIVMALLRIVTAVTLSVSPNHAFDKVAIVLKKKGYPQAMTI